MAKKIKKKKTVKKVKKTVKKVSAKGGSTSGGKKAAKALPKRKPIGKVTHFFDKIKVAIIKFNKPVKVGAQICFEGNKTCFPQVLNSMQYNHESIKLAKKGKEVGVKVKKEVKEGDLVFPN